MNNLDELDELAKGSWKFAPEWTARPDYWNGFQEGYLKAIRDVKKLLEATAK